MRVKNLSIASVAVCTTAAVALPSPKPFALEVDLLANSFDTAHITDCPVNGAVMPTLDASSSTGILTAPATGLNVVRVAIGRGTQNYTCADEASAPVAIGAVARLYDASCIAINFPTIFAQLPGLFLDVDQSQETFIAQKLAMLAGKDMLVGHHLFANTTTPVFDFRLNGSTEIFVGKKADDKPAPVNSPNGTFGAVDWLELQAIEGTVGYKTAYRVETAGGKQPATCAGMGKSFTEQYSAQYWFFD